MSQGRRRHASIKPDPSVGTPIGHYSPPEPAITPVRDVNDIITRAFNLYKSNFRSFLTIMAIGYAAYLAIYFVFALLPLPLTDISSTTLVGSTSGRLNSASRGLSVLASLARSVLSSFPLFLASGATIYATIHRYLGRDFSIRQAYSYALKMGAGIIILDILSELLSSSSVLLALVPGLALASSIIYLVIIIVIAPRFQVGQQALIAEQTDGFTAVSRSWRLVGSDKWSMSLNLWFVLAVRTVIPVIILMLLLILLTPILALTISIFVFAILGLLVTPLFDAAFTIFYLHLRTEREGLDLGTILARLDTASVDKKLVG